MRRPWGGPGQHFLGCAHTQANFETAFYRSTVADNDSASRGRPRHRQPRQRAVEEDARRRPSPAPRPGHRRRASRVRREEKSLHARRLRVSGAQRSGPRPSAKRWAGTRTPPRSRLKRTREPFDLALSAAGLWTFASPPTRQNRAIGRLRREPFPTAAQFGYHRHEFAGYPGRVGGSLV